MAESKLNMSLGFCPGPSMISDDNSTEAVNSIEVVIVEDPSISRYLKTLLSRGGYQVTEADPEEGVELIREHSGRVGLVITNSPQFFTEFAYGIPLLYMASCPDLNLVSRFRRHRVLEKPFAPRQLLEAVSALAGAL